MASVDVSGPIHTVRFPATVLRCSTFQNVDQVEFRVEYDERVGIAMSLYVNGVSLQDLIHPLELPLVTRHRRGPERAGEYAGLVNLDQVAWPNRHYLGEPRYCWYEDGDTILLGCICGLAEDRPLTALVTVDPHTVTWARFRLGGVPDWDVSGLGPFQFRHEQYVASLKSTATAQPTTESTFTEANIRDLATGTARLNGRAQLQRIEYVHSNRQTARALIFGRDDSDADNRAVVVIRLDSNNFTPRLPAPDRLATPTGRHMYLIVDAATGDLMETGLGDKTVDITKLGPTRHIVVN